MRLATVAIQVILVFTDLEGPPRGGRSLLSAEVLKVLRPPSVWSGNQMSRWFWLGSPQVISVGVLEI